ncbi:U6 snRNA-associated Sm-like protein LSm7 [Nematocida minor]|uniref:U6 snRNA-associated Sm-like protein LSm7 n=1 Tax=Nematocida minor TaxID=1912983 RepID=UPI00221FF0FA|nr:U6 snRNA-associated Sm-like protein LSm7 [Nematocida minor]KAI5192150.1 U6 snRNA-associated Sm-like protein LSm7 [Nematocida minor]
MQEDGKASKRDQVFDLEKYVGKNVKISFFGGIQVAGKLLGYDQLLNLVLENARMVAFMNPEEEESLAGLFSEPPSSMMCKGVSICSIDLLSEPEKSEQFPYSDNAYYTISQ